MYDIEDFEVETKYENGNGKRVCNILLVGVGGGGCNAVSRLMYSDITSADFVAVNTDAQALMAIKHQALAQKPNVKVKLLQIGKQLTGGQGAGADPQMGKEAAEESKEDIRNMLTGIQLCFIACGMGGGTGTGAAPVIARIAHEMNILTIAVVTKPFGFEGVPRMENAEKGIVELNKYIDSLIVVPNDKLDRKSVATAFAQADDVLKYSIKGIADLISNPCLINLDYADVCKIMSDRGYAHIGIGYGEGPGRALTAVKQAVKNDITDTTIYHATSMIISYQAGSDFNTEEIDNATNLVRKVLQDDAEIIFGLNIDPELGDTMTVTVIATGFKPAGAKDQPSPVKVEPAPRQDFFRKSDSFNAADAQRMMTERENSTINVQEPVLNSDNRIEVDDSLVPSFMTEMKNKDE
ncbi:MAG: cell division protein FtsZ [Clostridia bacterium]|nr:cell division protein FtsZ [Clostridia bacterium]